MSKKVYLLISFVLVLALGAIAVADDLEVPPFAGCNKTCAIFWDFDVEPPTATDYMYFPVVADPCITMDYFIGTVTWYEAQRVVLAEGAEINWYATPPDGTGSSITVYCQITYTGEVNDVFPMLELWDSPRQSGGEWLDGVEGPEAMDYYSAVEISPGVWHQTFYYTFDVPEEFETFLISVLTCVTDEFGGSGSTDIKEIVLDAVIHGGTPPEGCPKPGRPFGGFMVSNASPANGEDHVVPSTNLSFQAPWNALCLWEDDPCDPNDKPPDPNLKGPLKYDVYFGTEPNVLTMTQLADDYSPTNCNDVMVFDPCVGGDLADGTVYYWRVDVNDLDPCDPNFYEGPYFTFRTWGFADALYPVDGADGVTSPVLLQWGPDGYAASCDVYFGTSFSEVNDATTSSTEFKGNQAVADANYDAGMMDLSKYYYWRIDEKNGGGTAIKGEVWSFTTGTYFVAEDFDRYNNQDHLWTVWADYWTNGTDARIYLETDPNFTRDGNALRYQYHNINKSGGKYVGSVAEADLDNMLVDKNWTISGIRSLLVHFLGKADNSVTGQEHMWLELEDTSTNKGLMLYDGNMNNIKVGQWQEWNIDLGDANFSSVSLANVDKIRLGFGGYYRTGQNAASGAGTVYFDDIQLHPQRCRPEIVAWDIAEEDCMTDGYDIELMSEDWLVKDYQVFPSEPNRDNLLVEYLFDTDANYNDTSGNGNNGDASPTLTHVANGYLTIENVGGYVDIPFGASNPFHGPNDFSIFINCRKSDAGTTALMTSTDPCLPTDWEEPNIDQTLETYCPMGLILNQSHSGGPSNPDDITFYYDNWFVGGAEVATSEVGGIGSWHSVAVTYDADGGQDANGPTGLFTVYLNCTKGAEPANFDPNIPVDANYDVVRIGDGFNPLHSDDWGFGTHIGDFNTILIYDVALTEAEVYYLSGKVDPTYVPNPSLANVVPKSPPGGPYDANNPDIVNFLDFNLLAENWLQGPWLWPSP